MSTARKVRKHIACRRVTRLDRYLRNLLTLDSMSETKRLTKEQRAKALWLADVHGLETHFIAERYGIGKQQVLNILYEERKKARAKRA